jgi:hypothetical protein
MKGMTPDDLRKNMLATYFYLRAGIVILSFSLPPIMLGYSLVADGHLKETSINAFYGAYDYAMRDWFVGILWAVGSFLVMYKGFSTAEDWALNFAGGAAILLSINPCYCWTDLKLNNAVHTAFAVTFFACMIFVCWFCAYDTVSLLPKQLEPWFENAYSGIAIALAVMLVAAFILHIRFPDYKRIIFATEWAGVWIFAGYWALKSAEFHKTCAEERALKGELKKVKNFGLAPI